MIDVVNPELSLDEVAAAVPEAFSRAGVDEGVDERFVADAMVEDVEDEGPDEVDVAGFGLLVDSSVDEAIFAADSEGARLLWSWRSPLLNTAVSAADSEFTRLL